MSDAVIVSTARTPIGKACRGALNAKYAVVTMYVGGGMGAAGPFEVVH